jgi:aminoglycoside phosphotransferase family enzyme
MNQPPLPAHIQALFRSEAYPHPVENIEMIQTHISWVFLTGNFAYKLKKPLNLGFLNFSTLALRKYYCEQELELNRRLSADIYLDVLPICQQDDHYELGSSGEIVDYCLKMRQFDQSGLLDRRLNSNQFNPAWMDQLAENIARFHAEQESTVQFGHPHFLADHIRANLDVAGNHIGDALGERIMVELEDFARDALLHQDHNLLRRQAEGFIRPCHGDLHLKNIMLIDDKPCIFDCIEFSDEFRIIDTMNDVAFLVMDCDAHERADLGLRFLSRYLEHTGDYSGLSLLNLYLFYRATVRGKVASLLATELTEKNKRKQRFDEARKYFNLAAAYTRTKQAKLFAIGGLSGSGKSHLALLGSNIERAIIIRTDATRRRIAADFPDLELYGREMHINTYRTMFNAARTSLKAGFSVILDATFLHPNSRQYAFNLADTCAVPLHFFWLDINEAVLRERIKRRQSAANDISDADLRVFDLQLTEYQRPDEPWVQFLHSSESWPVTA